MLSPDVESNISKFCGSEEEVTVFKTILKKVQSNYIEEITEIRIYEYLLFFMKGGITYNNNDAWKEASSVLYPNKEVNK